MRHARTQRTCKKWTSKHSRGFVKVSNDSKKNLVCNTKSLAEIHTPENRYDAYGVSRWERAKTHAPVGFEGLHSTTIRVRGVSAAFSCSLLSKNPFSGVARIGTCKIQALQLNLLTLQFSEFSLNMFSPPLLNMNKVNEEEATQTHRVARK